MSAGFFANDMGHESAAGQWCLQCWQTFKRSTPAHTVLDEEPFCVACALQHGYTTEEIAGGKIVRKDDPAGKELVQGQPEQNDGPEVASAGSTSETEPRHQLRKIPGDLSASRICSPLVCKTPGCTNSIGPKCTTGLCTQCYAKKQYQEAKKNKGVSKPQPAANRVSTPSGQPPLMVDVSSDPASFSILLPVSILDYWWSSLSPGNKAQHFRESLMMTMRKGR